MKLIKPTAVALVVTLGAAGAFAIANAQTQAPANPQTPPGASESGPRGPGWGPGDGRGMGRWGMDRDDDRGWGGRRWGMGREGGMGPGDGMGPGWRHHRQFSKEDRAAFLNARIAAIHAGLGLTADQEKLWPPVESAVRDMAKGMSERFEKARGERPKDPIEGMKRRAEWQITRGEAMKKLADAAGPLYATLTTEQKDRLPALMRPGMRGHGGGWMHGHGMRWGWGRGDDRG